MIAEIIGAFLTGVLATFIALYRGQAQRMWDKKEAAYEVVLNALLAERRLITARIACWESDRDWPGPKDQKLIDAAQAASDTLYRYTHGAFGLTDQARLALKRARAEMDRAWRDGCEDIDGEAIWDDAIEAINQAAEDDRRSIPLWPLVWRRAKSVRAALVSPRKQHRQVRHSRR